MRPDVRLLVVRVTFSRVTLLALTTRRANPFLSVAPWAGSDDLETSETSIVIFERTTPSPEMTSWASSLPAVLGFAMKLLFLPSMVTPSPIERSLSSVMSFARRIFDAPFASASWISSTEDTDVPGLPPPMMTGGYSLSCCKR